MKQIEVLETLELAASDQWGIITTSQALREGITRLQLGRLADKGVLTRVQRGIYLLPSSQYGPLTDIRIAWVSLEAGQFPDERWAGKDRIVVSHESAALIHQLGELIPKKFTFSSTSRKQTSQDDIYIYNNRDITPQDVNNVEGLPVTSVELTVSDLAKKKIEFSYLASIVVDALRKENVRLKDIAEKLNEASEAYGYSSGRQLVLACQKEAEAEDDREERADRYLSTVDWSSLQRFGGLAPAGLAGLVDKLGINGGGLAAAALADKLGLNTVASAYAELVGKMGINTDGLGPVGIDDQLAKLTGISDYSSLTNPLAKYNNAFGAVGISELTNKLEINTSSLPELNSKQREKSSENTSKETLNGPSSSPSDQGEKQRKVTENNDSKKENRE